MMTRDDIQMYSWTSVQKDKGESLKGNVFRLTILLRT